ncbi:MAG: hypothetical protein F4X39_04450 [Acidobacteriia bacterium]|nr:hypothetical protein [Terriglobia bacterium]
MNRPRQGPLRVIDVLDSARGRWVAAIVFGAARGSLPLWFLLGGMVLGWMEAVSRVSGSTVEAVPRPASRSAERWRTPQAAPHRDRPRKKSCREEQADGTIMSSWSL